MKIYIKEFNEISLSDLKLVGTKNAYMGDIFNNLSGKHILVPNGFALTVAAYRRFVAHNKLSETLLQLIEDVDIVQYKNLNFISAKAKKLIMDAHFPDDLSEEIMMAYDDLFDVDYETVAVRSSAIAEELKEPFFANHYGSYLNIKGTFGLLYTIKQCFASLFGATAIQYRIENKINEYKVALPVCVHQMIRAEGECSGTCVSHISGTPGSDLIVLTGAWGLAENPDNTFANTPDKFKIFKDSLKPGNQTVIVKKLGNKTTMMTAATDDDCTTFTRNTVTPIEMQGRFVLSDNEIIKLANWALTLESHYPHPVSFKWAKDSINYQLFLIEAKPETSLQPVAG